MKREGDICKVGAVWARTTVRPAVYRSSLVMFVLMSAVEIFTYAGISGRDACGTRAN